MGYATQYKRPLTAEHQRALAELGWEDPNNWLDEYDVDITALEQYAQEVQRLVASLEDNTAIVRQASVPDWEGQAAIAYDECRMGFWDWVLIVIDRILWFVELVVLIVDWIVEIIRFVAELIDWLLGLLSVFGGILLLADQYGWKIPGWVRKILKLGKLVEKGPKIILTVVSVAAWLIAQFGAGIDWLLDKLREGIVWVRQKIAGCGGALDPLPDEPIEPWTPSL